MDHLSTAAEVIDALGGVRAVADLTDRKYSAAHNWKAFGRFPSKTHLVMSLALEAKGKTAPASLWGMQEPTVALEREPAVQGVP